MMNDPPGVQSALGIEAVEWFAEGGDNLTVRVTGRWRRRRPALGGQPVLVVEAQGTRLRFPAMPEPPSLTGTVPGTWRMSFSVPAWLAPHLGGRTWLQFGSVVVALPIGVEAAGTGVRARLGPADEDVEPPERSDPLDPETLSARRLQGAELASESARCRATEAELAAAELTRSIEESERELEMAHRDSERLSALLAEGERRQRAAQQLAHAEQALRLGLEEKLAAQEHENQAARQVRGELATAEERIRELEREIERLRRRADEAEQIAAAARAARARAEHEREQGVTAEQRALQALEEERAQRAAVEERAVRGLEEERDARAVVEQRAARAEERLGRALAEAGEQRALAEEWAQGLAEVRASREPRPNALADQRSLRGEREMAAHQAAVSRRVPSEPSVAALAQRVRERAVAPEAEAQPEPEPAARPGLPFEGDALAHTVRALSRELEMRASAEARLRSQLVSAQGRLEARLVVESQLSATLSQLRQELETLRSAVDDESAARAQAEFRAVELERALEVQRVRSERAYEAIEELRRALDMLRASRAAPLPPVPDPAGPVEPERLSEALVRLRESIAAEFVEERPVESADQAPGPGEADSLGKPEQGLDAPATEPPPPAPDHAPAPAPAVDDAPAPASDEPPAPGPPDAPPPPVAPDASAPAPHEPQAVPGPPAHATRAWLEPVFRTLAKRDPAGAGRLLVGLLPAQRAAYPREVAYDLILGGQEGCVQVTARGGTPEIRFADTPRDPSEVDFQVVGDVASVAALLTAGPLRRRFGRGVARVRGDRAALAALTGLVRTPLQLRELHAAGIWLDPVVALTVASLMIDPAWTAGERFTIAHQEAGAVSAYLQVGDSAPLTVTDIAPAQPVATTIVCPAEALLLVLDGDRPAEVAIEGEERPLELVVEWVKRAQSG